MSCCVTVSMCVHVIICNMAGGIYMICMHKPEGVQRLRQVHTILVLETQFWMIIVYYMYSWQFREH